MKTLIHKKEIIIFIFFISIYFYGFFEGIYLVDDWTIYSISNLDFISSFKAIHPSFYNRPLLALFFAIDSQFFAHSFKLQYSLNILILGSSSLIILSSLKDYFKNSLIKFFALIFLFFPIFSYTNILSPGMQISGNLSILLWSLSFYFLKKYLNNSNILNYFISSIFLYLLIITYESALPLVGMNIAFLIFDKNKFKKIILDLSILFFFILFGFLSQSLLLPDGSDVSRFRIDNFSVSHIIQNFFLNLFLLINTFFSFLDLIIIILKKNLINLFLLLSISFLIFKYFRVKIYHRDLQKKKILISFIISTFLLILMHVASESKIFFFGYGNRSLASLSVILTLLLILVSENIHKNKIIKFLYIMFFSLIPLLIINLQFENYNFAKNIQYKISYAEKIILENTNQKLLHNREQITYIYLDEFKSNEYYKITYDIENFDLRRLSKSLNENFRGFDLNPHKVCQKITWDLFYLDYILRSTQNSKVIYLIKNEKFKKRKGFSSEIISEIRSTYNCNIFKSEYTNKVTYLLKKFFNNESSNIQNARIELQKNLILTFFINSIYAIFSK